MLRCCKECLVWCIDDDTAGGGGDHSEDDAADE